MHPFGCFQPTPCQFSPWILFSNNWFGMFIMMVQHVTDVTECSVFSLEVWHVFLGTVIILPFLFLFIIHEVLERGHPYWLNTDIPSSTLSQRVLACASGMSVRTCELTLIFELTVIYMSIVVTLTVILISVPWKWEWQSYPFQKEKKKGMLGINWTGLKSTRKM